MNIAASEKNAEEEMARASYFMETMMLASRLLYMIVGRSPNLDGHD